MFKKLFKYFCSILILIPVSILLLLGLPIFAFRFLVAKFVIRFYPKIDKILTTRSTAFGTDAIYSKPKCTLVVATTIDGHIDLDRFRKLYQTRVIDRKNSDGLYKNPEWQQYITKLFGFLFWKWEKQFDIRNHVILYDGKFSEEFLSGRKPVNADTVGEAVNDLVYQPFQRKTSPWKAYLIHNYQATDPLTGTPTGPICTVFILRIHHSLGDGFSIVKTIQDELGQGGQLLIPKKTKCKSRNPISRIATAIDFFLSAPYEILSRTISAIDTNSWHIPEKDLKFKWNFALSDAIPLDLFKEVKNLQKVTLTTLILECFTAAVRKFMMEAGFTVPDVIHCGMPLPIPGHPLKMRNHMSGCIVPLPVGLNDYKSRLMKIEQNFEEIRKSTVPIAGFKVGPLGGGVFSWMVRSLFGNYITTAGMSNFPGPLKAVTIDGHTLREMVFGTGALPGNCGMGFTSLSYNGKIIFAMAIDEGLVPQSKLPCKKLIQYFMDHLELLRKEALV